MENVRRQFVESAWNELEGKSRNQKTPAMVKMPRTGQGVSKFGDPQGLPGAGVFLVKTVFLPEVFKCKKWSFFF